MALRGVALGGLLALLPAAAIPEAVAAQQAKTAQQIVSTMLGNEDAAAKGRDRYAYLSKERSERTGGHLWTEKVVETTAGKVRMLVAEDGQPLSPERIAAERGRLAQIAANPAAFQQREQAMKNDDLHAKQMLSLLPKAFLFGEVRPQGGVLLIDYRPNPDYSPQSMEERVLHGMSGTMQIDARTMRLHHIDGRLPEDVSIGFGILATIHAGSSFGTTRDLVDAEEWKTTSIDTEINGKAAFFKSIAKNQHSEHSEFTRVSNDLTVPQAVEMVER